MIGVSATLLIAERWIRFAFHSRDVRHFPPLFLLGNRRDVTCGPSPASEARAEQLLAPVHLSRLLAGFVPESSEALPGTRCGLLNRRGGL